MLTAKDKRSHRDISVYRQLEACIKKGDLAALLARWSFGRKLVVERGEAGRLPNGRMQELRNALRISDREIGYRMQFADMYSAKAEVEAAFKKYGSWFAITQRGLRPPAADSASDAMDAGEPAPEPPPRTVDNYCRGADQFRDLLRTTIERARIPESSIRKHASMLHARTKEIREALGELDQVLGEPPELAVA